METIGKDITNKMDAFFQRVGLFLVAFSLFKYLVFYMSGLNEDVARD
jgi:hypothetical protein